MENQKSNSSLNLLKQQWRQRLRDIRQALPTDRRKKASIIACEELFEKCEQASFVLSFASFGSEIDLWPLNRALAAEQRLVLPRLEGKTLRLYRVEVIEQLEKHPLGMLEPTLKHDVLFQADLSHALIPGLGFDLQTRHRLGYGGGHYDRFLSSLAETKTKTETWGIGFQEQAVHELPFMTEDVALKAIFLF